ncbi:hypothetical protein OJAV_G00103570 [Oryzias javanicus]|uniref:Uncharacterized protein n=1 Tax=Oryzias javanicus TaxID=123683 RepID=A0A437CXY5_ORYJA|nr:hypothetical protein OJAV_G00103570 [Oryzias javanicus]
MTNAHLKEFSASEVKIWEASFIPFLSQTALRKDGSLERVNLYLPQQKKGRNLVSGESESKQRNPDRFDNFSRVVTARPFSSRNGFRHKSDG